MIRLVSELTNTELLNRIAELEKYQITVTELLSKTNSIYQRRLLFKKHEMALIHYVHAVYEAAHRELITIH